MIMSTGEQNPGFVSNGCEALAERVSENCSSVPMVAKSITQRSVGSLSKGPPHAPIVDSVRFPAKLRGAGDLAQINRAGARLWRPLFVAECGSEMARQTASFHQHGGGRGRDRWHHGCGSTLPDD